jgi:pimeloyl-ACP methyl ester carboxylesterase
MKQTASFESQVDNLKSVDSHGGQAHFEYFRPEVLREGSVPVLIAGGWSEGTQSLRDTAEEAYKEGREVILVDHARSGGLKAGETDYNPEVAHKSRTLLNIINELRLEKVDVIAHSEGSLNAVLAATQQPEKFRNIILVAPAGLIGEDSIPRLIGRFVPKIARGMTKDMKEIKQRDPESAKRFAKSGPTYMRSNIRKGLREVGAIAHTQIDGQLDDLRSAGIHIGVLQSHRDSGFPDKRIYKHIVLQEADGAAGYQDLQTSVHSYASVASIDAGHDDLIIHPERSTRAALDMLAELEKIER